MKTLAKIKCFGAVFISLLIACVCLSFGSCENPPRILQHNQCKCGFDSTMVIDLVQSLHNPTFSSPYDLTRYRHQIEENNKLDSLFMSLPQDVLVDAAKVLLKTSMSVSLSDVIHEYLDNSNIYDTLGSATDTVELQVDTNTPPDSPYDTIIDGKQYKLVNSEQHE